jgi:hypothetical protein
MVTALRLFVAFLMLLSFSVFLYGYVHFTFVEHQPVGGAFGWAIIYACVLPLLLWPEFQWLWRKLRVSEGSLRRSFSVASVRWPDFLSSTS